MRQRTHDLQKERAKLEWIIKLLKEKTESLKNVRVTGLVTGVEAGNFLHEQSFYEVFG